MLKENERGNTNMQKTKSKKKGLNTNLQIITKLESKPKCEPNRGKKNQ